VLACSLDIDFELLFHATVAEDREQVRYTELDVRALECQDHQPCVAGYHRQRITAQEDRSDLVRTGTHAAAAGHKLVDGEVDEHRHYVGQVLGTTRVLLCNGRASRDDEHDCHGNSARSKDDVAAPVVDAKSDVRLALTVLPATETCPRGRFLPTCKADSQVWGRFRSQRKKGVRGAKGWLAIPPANRGLGIALVT
jgi:hypothetical protein